MLNETYRGMLAHKSVIRETFTYGKQRAAQIGYENVFDYSLGNPSVPCPQEFTAAMQDLLANEEPVNLHGYCPSQGDPGFRTAVAAHLAKTFGLPYEQKHIFPTTGAAGAIAHAIRAVTQPGDEVLTFAPYFPEYGPYVAGTGAVLKVVPPQAPTFQPNLDAFEQMIGEKTTCVLINTPNNPSGVVYTRKTLEALGALLTQKSLEYGHPIYLISDEPYRELAYGVEVPFVPLIYPNTVVCYSYSKSLSLPGERIGYIYVPDSAADSRALYAAVAGAARSAGHVCAPSLWQKVIARCAGLRPDLQAYDRNRKALYEGLTAMGYEMAKPDGAFYLFIKAPGGDANAFSEKAKERDLLLVPGDGFGCPGYFRICYCVSYDMIQRSLPVFRALINED